MPTKWRSYRDYRLRSVNSPHVHVYVYFCLYGFAAALRFRRVRPSVRACVRLSVAEAMSDKLALRFSSSDFIAAPDFAKCLAIVLR